ncbi:TonB-dependent receptor [Flavobacterium sp.]|uniref:SusC/RagA family TonB-linked outer membrane protein n=1 Tax=Flavobacterium sp. TaxID=239 RepID=UPI002630C1ED|nr:TonB-dependent receptor [Flavobacterium sp.]
MRSKFKWIFSLLLAMSMQFVFAQEKIVSGTVTDETGAVPGVNVVISGTKTGTQTGFDGKYSIKAKQGDVLVFSFLGMDTQRKTVGASSVIDVAMAGSVKLQEVVVTVAYGTQSKKKLVQANKIVTAESIENVVALSPQELLQGQAAGVQVVNSSGVLGSATQVKIRGNASISGGGRPLFVIDGVPMNDLQLTTAQGGQALNPLLEINPNDIESMTVLKDASATAIYGSRGSNGVVLITTKKGKKGQATRITFDQTLSISESTDELRLMNGDQYRRFKTLRNNGTTDNPANFLPGNVDWFDALSRTGVSNDTNVGVSGGSEKTSFYVGFGRSDQQGFILGNNFEITSGRVSIDHEANDYVKIGANMSYAETKNDRVGSENSTFAPFTGAALIAPWAPIYLADGSFAPASGFIPNLVAIETLDINDANTTRFTGNVFAEVKLLKGLKFKTDFGVDRSFLEQFQRSFEINSPTGYGYNDISTQNKYVVTNTLSYDKVFMEKHSVSALLGSTYEQNEVRVARLEATGFASDLLLNLTSGATKTLTTTFTQNSRLNGYFARINYDYDKKYLLELTGRRDGSSRFAEDYKYGLFWAAGFAWNAKQEAFLQDSSVISDLKLRASIGTAGNDRVGDFQFFPLYSGGAGGAYNNTPGFSYTQPANNTYRWELSKTINLGTDISLFDSRVNLSVDVYDKKTTDLILSPPIPATNGFNTITGNFGSMQNRGIEIDLNTVNIKTPNFEWSTSFNIARNDNKVLSLPGAAVDLDGNRFVTGSASQRAIEGYSINTFFLIRYKGVNPQTGDAEWLDKAGNVTTTPTANDRVIAGDANPDFVGGITNTFKYKNFDLNIFANFSYGNDIFVDGQRFTDNITAGGDFNKDPRVLDYWTTPGQVAYAPSLTSATRATFNQRSTAQLKDGSFLRLKNITLGYNLPKAIFERIGFISSVRLYGTVTNLYTFKSDELKGIDPETTSTLANLGAGETFFTPPQFKSYLLGAKLTF